jgi:hypothetical protein
MLRNLLLLSFFASLIFSLGPDNVTQLSGYITVPGVEKYNATNLFYWFFEYDICNSFVESMTRN